MMSFVAALVVICVFSFFFFITRTHLKVTSKIYC